MQMGLVIEFNISDLFKQKQSIKQEYYKTHQCERYYANGYP